MSASQLISMIRVSSCEVDSFGHVNNAVYLQYCERARNDYMLQCGLSFSDFQLWDAGPVLFRAELQYRRPARVDDELRVIGEIERRGKTRFHIGHHFVRVSDEENICTARLDFAFVDLTSGRPCRVPDSFMKAFGVE